MRCNNSSRVGIGLILCLIISSAGRMSGLYASPLIVNSSVIANSAVTRTVIAQALVYFSEFGVSGFAEWSY